MPKSFGMPYEIEMKQEGGMEKNECRRLSRQKNMDKMRQRNKANREEGITTVCTISSWK